MMIRTKRYGIFMIWAVMTHCGPEVDQGSGLDPEETFTAFCEKLFACPEEFALETYGSQKGCEDVHRADYEGRDRTCKEVVLIAEDCMAKLSCNELPSDCKIRLDEEGCDTL
jgi:hypothetical protein